MYDLYRVHVSQTSLTRPALKSSGGHVNERSLHQYNTRVYEMELRVSYSNGSNNTPPFNKSRLAQVR